MEARKETQKRDIQKEWDTQTDKIVKERRGGATLNQNSRLHTPVLSGCVPRSRACKQKKKGKKTCDKNLKKKKPLLHLCCRVLPTLLFTLGHGLPTELDLYEDRSTSKQQKE